MRIHVCTNQEANFKFIVARIMLLLDLEFSVKFLFFEITVECIKKVNFLYARQRRDVLCDHPPFFVRSISPRLY